MRKGSKKEKPLTKCILKDEVKEELLQSQMKMGAVAESTNKTVGTLQNQLKAESPILTYPITVAAIKEALGISTDADICQIVPND